MIVNGKPAFYCPVCKRFIVGVAVVSAEAKEQARAYRVEPRRNLRRVREKGEKTMPEWMIDFLANELRVWEERAVKEEEHGH